MENHKDTIEYLAALAAFLLPFYVATLIYEMIKTKNYNNTIIIKLVVCVVLLAGAYYYLDTTQRYIAIALVIALAIIMTIVISTANIFKK